MVKFMRRATGHFMTLIEIGMNLIMCISGHISDETENSSIFTSEKSCSTPTVPLPN